jgi:hypothetical protein
VLGAGSGVAGGGSAGGDVLGGGVLGGGGETQWPPSQMRSPLHCES